MDNIIYKHKWKIFIAVIILSIIGSWIDVIFFSHYLYQNITGEWMLFFIRTFLEIFIFVVGIGLGIALGIAWVKTK